MSRYRYKVARSGEVKEGHLEAPSQADAVRRLQAQGYVPVRVEEAVLAEEKRRRRWRSGIRIADVELFTVEFAALLKAGLTLTRALDTLAELLRHRAFGEVIADLHVQVRGGVDLSAAMEQHPRTFPRLYRNMVQAGEAGGALDAALERVADHLERTRALREALVSALIYPVLLLAFAGLSLGVILGVVIPRISGLFIDAGRELPAATQLVVQLGSFVRGWWWAIFGGVGLAVFGLRWKLRHAEFREAWDRRLLRLPVVGEQIARYEAARFTRTLGTLLQGSVSLLEAMEIACHGIGNRSMETNLRRISGNVRQGQGLSGPLLESGVLPGPAATLVQVGEETGHLGAMLLQAADIYDREMRTGIKRAADILGPVLILLLAVLIGAIVMSVLVAVLGINELAF